MNKKIFYIISSTLLLIGLFAGVVQYVGMFDTLYAAAVNPGHSWSQMECSTALCVDTVNNRVGVGTTSPQTTFDVNGAVKLGNFTTCNASTEGTIRYQGGSVSFCYNSTWNNIRNLNWQCGDDFVDTRDNKVYRTIQMGSYCWMKDNLAYSSNPSFEKMYDNQSHYLNVKAGLLYYTYNYTSCPSGWHLSTYAEWNYLFQAFPLVQLVSPQGFNFYYGGMYSSQQKLFYGFGIYGYYVINYNGYPYVCGIIYSPGYQTYSSTCVQDNNLFASARCVKDL